MPVDKFGRMSDTKTRDTGVSLTYINNNYIRSDGISEITGNLNMASHTIENLGNPTNPKDAVTKEYADTHKKKKKKKILLRCLHIIVVI